MNTKPYIKIYGERNSGTKYLERLIAINLNCHILRGTEAKPIGELEYEWFNDLYFFLKGSKFLGWKHSVPNIKNIRNFSNNNPLLIITITKNPYAYLLSLYDRPHHMIGQKPERFQEFLTTPWRTRYRDQCQKKLKSPIDLWNLKNKSYIDIKNKFDNVVNTTYEGLIAEPGEFINNISLSYEIKKYNSFQNILQSTNTDSYKGFNELRKYYLEEEWRKKLALKNIETINKSLSIDILNYFNYKLL